MKARIPPFRTRESRKVGSLNSVVVDQDELTHAKMCELLYDLAAGSAQAYYRDTQGRDSRLSSFSESANLTVEHSGATAHRCRSRPTWKREVLPHEGELERFFLPLRRPASARIALFTEHESAEWL